jgi:hypothetical protein
MKHRWVLFDREANVKACVRALHQPDQGCFPSGLADRITPSDLTTAKDQVTGLRRTGEQTLTGWSTEIAR